MKELKNVIKNLTVIKGRTYALRVVAYNRAADLSDDPETLTDTVKNITGFTAKIIVKINKEDADSAAIFEVTGTVTAPTTGVIEYTLTAVNNNVEAGQYWYETYIYNSTEKHTLNIGQYNIFDNVKDSI